MSTANSPKSLPAMQALALPTVPHPKLSLQNGDHLTREEFLFRWEASPNLKRAELLEGIVYMPAAVRHSQHSAPHGDIMGWLWSYRLATPGIGLGDNGSVGLDEFTVPQPDAYLLLPPELGSGARENSAGYLEGPPDLIAEIAASSASIDLHLKLKLYQTSGVPEYIVWRTEERLIDWFVLQDGRYIPLVAEDGILKSRRFPGLWLNVTAMVAGNPQGVHATLQLGLATAEHAAFREQLLREKKL
ncbi:hypothetical protein ETAA8_66530 [Anatilimnocola aggregata]|uniref:Putative restriction endonuclease domain-containing protein n=1 Tax=Anatilimnocola aggregata TaxID=2528021 RepID=A0A517YMQ1_9BACT|nr:Uma2 family endonuclease [Anatilimnocola aggregata]QDU31494.1 hypothetical protein ETAA8_66530 [Anatilimnocola aggregata]